MVETGQTAKNAFYLVAQLHIKRFNRRQEDGRLDHAEQSLAVAVIGSWGHMSFWWIDRVD